MKKTIKQIYAIITNLFRNGRRIIAIDGYPGTGKSTIATEIAKREKIININSGKIYRAISYVQLKENVTDLERLIKIVDEKLVYYIDEKNELVCKFENSILMDKVLYSKEVASHTPVVAGEMIVRNYIEDKIRELVNSNEVIMEGRDICTKVLKDIATIKLFFTASLEIRASRRYEQIKDTGISYEEVLESIKNRDETASERENGKLIWTKGTMYIDTSNLEFEEMVDFIEDIINFNQITLRKKICIIRKLISF